MKIKNKLILIIAAGLVCLVHIDKVYAADISSKGRYEAFDENTNSHIIIDSNDFKLLLEEINRINKNVGGITNKNAIPNRVVITDDEGKITTSDISSDELKNLKGVSSNIQEQIEDLALRISKFGTNINLLYKAVDGLDNNFDNSLSGTPITKDVTELTKVLETQRRTKETATIVSQNNNYANIKIPTNGYYTTNSEIMIPLSYFGDVESEMVLSGSTFSSSDGVAQNGTMKNYSMVSVNIDDDKGKNYTINGAQDSNLNSSNTCDNSLISSYGEDKMLITLPLTGYVSNPKIIIDNDVITKQNTVIKNNVITEYMSDLDIHTIDGYATGTVRFSGGMNDQGWCYGQGSIDVVAWTNNLGKTVKFLPISGINEGACTLEPGDELHATIRGSYHSLEYKSTIVQTNRTYYKFYLLY